jgi:hypothetical protein
MHQCTMCAGSVLMTVSMYSHRMTVQWRTANLARG